MSSSQKIIEAWGSGIPKLMQAMKAYGLREPEFIDMDVAFRINLYRGQNEINGGNVSDIGGNVGGKMPDIGG